MDLAAKAVMSRIIDGNLDHLVFRPLFLLAVQFTSPTAVVSTRTASARNDYSGTIGVMISTPVG